MADATPHWALERMKLERQRKQIELNVFDCQVRLVEIDGEAARLRENIAASERALTDLDTQIAGIAVPEEE